MSVDLLETYHRMIDDVAAELVEDLEDSALRCAFTATAIPTQDWHERIHEKVSELVMDILADAERLRRRTCDDVRLLPASQVPYRISFASCIINHPTIQENQ